MLSLAATVVACAACQCGDPTLTTMGSEKPFEGRFRLSTELRHRTDRIGEPGVHAIDVSEQRLDLGVSYAPRAWLFLSATVPLVRMDVTYVNLARDTRATLGDVELRAKAFVYQDRAWSPHHLVAVHAGAELPTASVDRGDDMKLETLPGSGSIDPLAGVSYGYFHEPWSAYASATLYWPTAALGIQGGRSLRTTVAAQYQPTFAWALQLGLDSRWDGRAIEHGAPEPDTGGFIAFASPQISYSPAEDLLVHVGVRIPVLDALHGWHDEGVILAAGAAYDL